jgi:hypothetical protein
MAARRYADRTENRTPAANTLRCPIGARGDLMLGWFEHMLLVATAP